MNIKTGITTTATKQQQSKTQTLAIERGHYLSLYTPPLFSIGWPFTCHCDLSLEGAQIAEHNIVDKEWCQARCLSSSWSIESWNSHSRCDGPPSWHPSIYYLQVPNSRYLATNKRTLAWKCRSWPSLVSFTIYLESNASSNPFTWRLEIFIISIIANRSLLCLLLVSCYSSHTMLLHSYGFLCPL